MRKLKIGSPSRCVGAGLPLELLPFPADVAQTPCNIQLEAEPLCITVTVIVVIFHNEVRGNLLW